MCPHVKKYWCVSAFQHHRHLILGPSDESESTLSSRQIGDLEGPATGDATLDVDARELFECCDGDEHPDGGGERLGDVGACTGDGIGVNGSVCMELGEITSYLGDVGEFISYIGDVGAYPGDSASRSSSARRNSSSRSS